MGRRAALMFVILVSTLFVATESAWACKFLDRMFSRCRVRSRCYVSCCQPVCCVPVCCQPVSCEPVVTDTAVQADDDSAENAVDADAQPDALASLRKKLASAAADDASKGPFLTLGKFLNRAK